MILFWQPENERYPWQLRHADNETTRNKTTLEIVASAVNVESNRYRLIVIIPSSYCFFTEVKVPPGSDNKISVALPYLLEEKIADEPETLFITRLAKVDQERWNVVAIRKQWLREVIQKLRAHGLEADAIIPDVLLLPQQENCLSLALNQNYCWLRYANTAGMQLERNNLLLLLDSLNVEATIAKDVVLFCEKNEKDALKSMLMEHGFKVIAIKEVNDWGAFFSENAGGNLFNLLQGDFAPKSKSTQERKLLKIAGIILAVSLGLSFFGKIIQYFFFKYQYHITQTEIESSYRRIFPDITRIVSPKTTLQKELQKLNTAKQHGSFLYLMTEFGTAFTKTPNAQIETLDYKNGVLTITLKVENFTLLKELGQNLDQQGFIVKQENAVSQNNAVISRLILQKGAK